MQQMHPLVQCHKTRILILLNAQQLKFADAKNVKGGQDGTLQSGRRVGPREGSLAG